MTDRDERTRGSERDGRDVGATTGAARHDEPHEPHEPHELHELTPLDVDLARFVEAAQLQLDADLREDAPTPDAAATLRCAHVLDAHAVPEAWVERAELEANVVPLRRHRTADTEALAPFVVAMRRSVADTAHERRLAGIPPLTFHEATPAVVLQGRPHAARTRWARVLGVAAVVAVASLVGSLVGAPRPEATNRGSAPSVTARRPLGAPDRSVGADAHEAPRRVATSPTVAQDGSPTAGPTHAPPHAVGIAADGGDSPPIGVPFDAAQRSTSPRDGDDVLASDPTLGRPGARVPRSAPRVHGQASAAVASAEDRGAALTVETASMSLEDRLRALDGEAAAAWREGRLDDATSALERIVEIGGKRRQVEAAFADLFAITRQRVTGDARERELSALWSRYLDRFPQGRHADDARAGSCRVAPAHTRADCWRDYLTHHPEGEHVEPARRALGETEPAGG
jgi:hypothetical protein